MRSSKDNTSKTDPSETGSMRSALGSLSSTGQEDNIHASKESIEDKEEQLVYLITNILFTILWRGIENNGGDSWKVSTHAHPKSIGNTMRMNELFMFLGTWSGFGLHQFAWFK